MSPREPSLYDRVGGEAYFVALVDRFYEGVERDPVLRPLYPADLGPGKANLAGFQARRACSCTGRADPGRGRSPRPHGERAGMTLSPAELRHERPGRGLFGYRRTDVDRLLVEATVAYENVWRERADLTDQVHELQQELIRHREGEQAMRNALVTAERAADEMRASATRQAELIVREAEAKSRDLVHEAYAERERVRRETSRLQAEEAEFRLRLRSLLGAVLEAVRDHEERLAGSLAEHPEAVTARQPAIGPADDVVSAGS